MPWVRYWPADVPIHVDYPVVTLYDRLRESARKYPNQVALWYEGRELTYADLDSLTDRFAAGLQELGIIKGDRVALYLPNSPHFVVALYGIFKAGAVAIPCNPAYKEEELHHLLKDSGAKILVTVDKLVDTALNVLSDTSVGKIIISDGLDFLVKSNDLGRRLGGLGVEIISLGDFLESSPSRPKDVEIDAREDIALICYTGGTTGTPKGVMLTHYNCVVNNIQKITTWKLREAGEVLLIYLPLTHIYGLNWCLNTGIGIAAKIILQQRFNIEKTLEAIEKHRVTIFYGVPPVYVALSRHPEIKKRDLSSVRIWMSAAAPLLPEVRKRFEEITGIKIIECWGLTEAAPCLTFTPLDIQEVKPNLIGIPTIDTEVKVIDIETGLEAGPNEVGELVAKGPQVMKGYWNNPEETSRVLKNGWLRTGDLGYMTEDGLFYYVDRIKDLINVGGFKVWPAEVENILLSHPAVLDCTVVAEEDEYYGEVPKAFVVLRDEYKNKVSSGDLIGYCRERLASFKAPRYVVFVDEIPRSPAGKVLRRTFKKRT
ncbi:MAG TPA: long-chain fatty acid--CoA ligase [Candidatus Caldiarchaeum subterraneum]|uniref:Long-chain fatty acid--CoA ligase n=1 Tax=Caldiarchaeum subterraneum TaxID=311458 RepID=A0A833EBT5_CALS0|nr:long-chain fatty acid--CoA ligase [Candidatus Caldarchaeum subterraneum]